MLPTPDTSHVPYERVYEPAEDSFLLLDTLSSPSETRFLHDTFSPTSSSSSKAGIPLVVEIGTGSGVVLAFITAHAKAIFGTNQVLTAGIDMNAFACRATVTTVAKAQAESMTENSNGSSDGKQVPHGMYLGSVMGDLAAPLKPNSVDVLVFNPPYVPTSEMPSRPETFKEEVSSSETSFDDDSYLLALSYAGGADGMETTDRLIAGLHEVLSPRGCAYVLLCAQNKPEAVKERIRGMEGGWRAETVGSSGKTAGWEKLQIVRIWRGLA
ncbi:eRF1 methyltransferase catalytic subunit MTQ2 [Trichoderma ghanense]|uniref:ERF1 methyltransferase catalytic subunit MTQ2 n=1 Tax=Trichoderma ghanense TaxID=65468 RepID=A0ABY2HD52_9HYPO